MLTSEVYSFIPLYILKVFTDGSSWFIQHVDPKNMRSQFSD